MIRKFVLYWLPPLTLMSVIFMLSNKQSISVSEELFIDFLFFKGLHVLEYATLTFLMFRALYKTTRFSFEHILSIALLVALLYGLTDEIHQTFVPTRTGSFRDIGIDLIGIFAIYLVLKTHFQRFKKYMY